MKEKKKRKKRKQKTKIHVSHYQNSPNPIVKTGVN
jgi:hypothetical protein